MKWIKVTLETTTEAADVVSCLLIDLSVSGVEIEDKIPLTEEEKKQMFIDILPDLPEDDGVCFLHFYLEEGTDIDMLKRNIADGMTELAVFTNVGSGRISISETEDKDWQDNWKQYFKPFRADKHVLIKPSWEVLTEQQEDDLVIELDPGTAFGTGTHETTKLCIQSLGKYCKAGMKVLDVGCGSGILSILAKRLDASVITGVDVDANAIRISKENAEMNQINSESEDGILFLVGDMIEDFRFRAKLRETKYDLVVANILADIIVPLSAVVSEVMNPSGFFISSGILKTKQQAVEEALHSHGFQVMEVTSMGDWVSIAASFVKER